MAETHEVEQKGVLDATTRQFILTRMAEGDSIKDIALTLDMDESVVTEFLQYVSQTIVNKDLTTLDQSKRFVLSYMLSEDGNVTVGVQWPHPSKIQDYIDAIPRLLYILHKGALKSETVSMLLSFAEEHKCHALINKIIGDWSAIEMEQTKSRPIVSPDEVFA